MIGATGAVGKEIIRHALSDRRISQITVIVRKPLPEWAEHTDKILVIEKQTLDDIEEDEALVE